MKQHRQFGEYQDNKLELILFITNKCNLNCLYCFEQHKNKEVISYDIAIKNIKNVLLQDKYEFVTISFFGGEPAMEMPLIKQICEWTWSQGFNKPFRFLIQTNGTFFSTNDLDWLEINKEKIIVSLSLDGLPATHNYNRSSSYEKIPIQRILEIWENPPVKMTINPMNISRLADDIIFLQKLGFKITGCNIAEASSFDFNEDFFEEFSLQLKYLADYYIAYPQKEIAPILNLPLYKCEQHLDNDIQCSLGTDKLICINTDGEIVPCPFFSTITHGHSAYKQLAHIANSINTTNIPNDCIKCYLHPICRTCYGDNFYCTGDIHKPSHYKCRITKLRACASAYMFAYRIINKKDELISKNEKDMLNAYRNICSIYKL